MFPGISTYSISLFWFGLEKFEKTFVIIVSLSLFFSVAWRLPFFSFFSLVSGLVLVSVSVVSLQFAWDQALAPVEVMEVKPMEVKPEEACAAHLIP